MVNKKTTGSVNGLTHFHTPRKGDKEAINEYLDRFKDYTNKELIEACNALNGLYGVHKQVLYIIALHQEFLKRFNQSPFETSENNLIDLGGKIVYIESSKRFTFVEQN